MKILATVLTSAAFLALAAPAFADDVKAATDSPAGVSDHSAILRGNVTSTGISLGIYFQYGRTNAYGSQTDSQSLLFSNTLAVKAAVTNLDTGAEYHYRVVASGLFGAVYGKDVTFKTNLKTDDGSGSTSSSSGGEQGGVSSTPGADAGSSASQEPEVGDTTAGAGSKPELGQKVVAGTASGTVGVKSPGASGWATLAGNAPVPVGSIVDARRGTVQLVTALPDGTTQAGSFHGAMFQVRQPRSGHGMTELVLHGGSFAACGSSAQHAGAAHAAGRSRVVRRLWGSDHHGRFRTRGSNSIATVRGTSWVTTDRCDGTLTSVSKGAVSVRDLRARRTVLVHAGHSYLARGRR